MDEDSDLNHARGDANGGRGRIFLGLGLAWGALRCDGMGERRLKKSGENNEDGQREGQRLLNHR
jgi:hypothetical protein